MNLPEAKTNIIVGAMKLMAVLELGKIEQRTIILEARDKIGRRI